MADPTFTPPPASLLAPPKTDTGNAERLVLAYGRNIRYCNHARLWYIWEGKRWKPDDKQKVLELCKQMIRALRAEVTTIASATEREQWEFWLGISESLRGRNAMEQIAQCFSTISIRPEELDTDPYLLNVDNGTVDLRTGELLPFDRERFITYLIRFPYDPTVDCPLWKWYLLDVMEGNEGMVSYLQKALGYSLTAITNEKCLFMLQGKPDCGKSTLLYTFKYVLDPGPSKPGAKPDLNNPSYAGQISVSSLMAKSSGGLSARDDRAGLNNVRFALTSETDRESHFSEATLKSITQGMGSIRGEKKFRSAFSFNETHKLWIDANHLPDVDADEEAVWRRLHLVPFHKSIPREEIDYELGDKLKLEAPGILAWAIQGAVRWKQERLGRPPEVQAAVDAWRKETDFFEQFFADKCNFGPDLHVTKAVLAKELHEWLVMEQGRNTPYSSHEMKKRLALHDIQDSTMRVANNPYPVDCWRGIELKRREVGE
jgi:putative DNA primase/helicase